MITLISCIFPDTKALAPPGVMALGAAFRAAGVDVEIVDIQTSPQGPDVQPEDVVEMVADKRPEMIGFSSMSNMLPFALTAAEAVKKEYPETKIIFGGCGVQSVLAEVLGAYPYVDFAFHGEGDITAPQFVKAYQSGGEWRDTPGLAFRDGTKIVINPAAPRIQDLDSLPRPGYDMLDMSLYTAPIGLMTTRGCPFKCTYCDGGAWRGMKPINRSADGILDEVEALVEKYGRKRFSFVDDTFTVPLRRAEAFCNRYLERGCDFEWGVLVRVNTVNDELMSLMKRAGCGSLYFGVESGSERVSERINKNLKMDVVEKVLSQASEKFESVTASFIWGFPFEEIEDLEQTFLLASYLHTVGVEIQTHLWSPMPQSALFEEYKDQLVFDPEFCSNIAHSKFSLDRYVDMIASNAKVFAPFYHVPHPGFEKKRELISNLGFIR